MHLVVALRHQLVDVLADYVVAVEAQQPLYLGAAVQDVADSTLLSTNGKHAHLLQGAN